MGATFFNRPPAPPPAPLFNRRSHLGDLLDNPLGFLHRILCFDRCQIERFDQSRSSLKHLVHGFVGFVVQHSWLQFCAALEVIHFTTTTEIDDILLNLLLSFVISCIIRAAATTHPASRRALHP